MKKNVIYSVLVVIAIIVVALILKINKKCVVTFDTGGGTIYASKQLKCGSTIKKPEDPYLPGYSFVKWVDIKTNEEFDFSKNVDSDITIKAIYVEELS